MFTSTDGQTWGDPILKDKFKDTDKPQNFPLDKVKARYFKLEGLSGYTRKAAAVGEISLHGLSTSKK